MNNELYYNKLDVVSDKDYDWFLENSESFDEFYALLKENNIDTANALDNWNEYWNGEDYR